MGRHASKLHDILKELVKQEQYKNHYEPFVKINRFYLSLLIRRSIDVVGRNAVYSWINTLLSHGYIRMNPTSSYSMRKGKLLPTNDSKYFVDIDKIRLALIEFELQNRSIPENQKANMETLPQITV